MQSLFIVIHYYLSPQNGVPRTDIAAQHQAVEDAFREWASLGIGLQFKRVEDPSAAEVRVSFQDNGSWSYVGTDAIDLVKSPNATMVRSK